MKKKKFGTRTTQKDKRKNNCRSIKPLTLKLIPSATLPDYTFYWRFCFFNHAICQFMHEKPTNVPTILSVY
jgi:hypothetical protein